MNSLPPLLFFSRLASTGCSAACTFSGCVVFVKSVTALHAPLTCSTDSGLPMGKSLPSVRSQRSLPMKPPPTSKMPPFSSQLSWHSQATNGETYSGLSASTISLGMMVSVRREPATGAMMLVWMPRLTPSSASVWPKPTRPILAIE